MNSLIVIPQLLQFTAWHRDLYRQLQAVSVNTLSREGMAAEKEHISLCSSMTVTSGRNVR